MAGLGWLQLLPACLLTRLVPSLASCQVGESWNELAHIRQAVTFLLIPQKQHKSFDEITQDLCSSLSVQQLYRISTMYWDDRWVSCGLGGQAWCTQVLQGCSTADCTAVAFSSCPAVPHKPFALHHCLSRRSAGTTRRRSARRCWRR